MIRIAIIGCGFWGTNFIRVFGEISDSNVVLLCDSSEDRLRLLRERYSHMVMTSRWEDVPESSNVDAVVIATDASTYFSNRTCLARSKASMCWSRSHSRPPRRMQNPDSNRRATRPYFGLWTIRSSTTSGSRKIKQLMRGGGFGRVYYLHATRTNLGPIRMDVDSFWDLASHDVSIFNYLLDAQPEWVSAVGARLLSPERADVGFVTLTYPGGVIANAHNSWLDPNKVREVVVVRSRQRIVFDDLNNVERVRRFEKGRDVYQSGRGQLWGVSSPGSGWRHHRVVVETGEPLRNKRHTFLTA